MLSKSNPLFHSQDFLPKEPRSPKSEGHALLEVSPKKYRPNGDSTSSTSPNEASSRASDLEKVRLGATIGPTSFFCSPPSLNLTGLFSSSRNLPAAGFAPDSERCHYSQRIELQTPKARPVFRRAGLFVIYIPGDDLLSHKVALAVPSALEGLTSVFGMGTGVTPPLRSPGNCSEYLARLRLLGEADKLGIYFAGEGSIASVRCESLLFGKFYGQASRPISTR